MGFTTVPTFTAGNVLTAAQQTILAANETFLANPPTCRVYNSAAISLTSGTAAFLTFDSERFDTDSMHSTVSNTGRITFTTAGKYLVGGNVEFTDTGLGTRQILIRANGATSIAAQGQGATASGGAGSILSVVTEYQFAAGDYVELRAYQNSGSSQNAVVTSNYSPEFWAIWKSL